MALSISKLTVCRLLSLQNIHTSIRHSSRAAKAFKKVMGYTSKKRRMYNEMPILPTAQTFSEGSQEGHYSKNSRRASVLNKLFMRHITDLMATGENATEFLGHGIEINRVQIAPDYKCLNVFWVAKGNQSDEKVENILKKNAGYLRHELSSLRVIGVVPLIKFVKDRKYAQIMEVDVRLAQADFGEDHIPMQLEEKLKTQLEIHIPIDPKIKDEITRLEEKYLEAGEEYEYEEPLPQMPQDVLGLNHADILNRIKKRMKTAESRHRLGDNVENPEVLSSTVNESPVQYSRELFKSFLEKRELLRSKRRKADKNYHPDLEFLKEETLKMDLEYFKSMDIYDHQDEKDYLEEIEEDNKD